MREPQTTQSTETTDRRDQLLNRAATSGRAVGGRLAVDKGLSANATAKVRRCQ